MTVSVGIMQNTAEEKKDKITVWFLNYSAVRQL